MRRIRRRWKLINRRLHGLFPLSVASLHMTLPSACTLPVHQYLALTHSCLSVFSHSCLSDVLTFCDGMVEKIVVVVTVICRTFLTAIFDPNFTRINIVLFYESKVIKSSDCFGLLCSCGCGGKHESR